MFFLEVIVKPALVGSFHTQHIHILSLLPPPEHPSFLLKKNNLFHLYQYLHVHLMLEEGVRFHYRWL